MFSPQANTTKFTVNVIGKKMFPRASIEPAGVADTYATPMRSDHRAPRNPMSVFACSVMGRAARQDRKTNMTLFYSHHDRHIGSAGGFSVGRAVRRLRTALKTVHRAIAAARIRRLRNELRWYAAARAKCVRSPQPDGQAHGDRIPRQPLHLGEKWDF
jgi:hypothetical protein